MRVYSFIDSQKAEFAVGALCGVCGVARSSYHAWAARSARGATEGEWDDAVFLNRVYDVWAASRGCYGSPRVCEQLWREGIVANHKRVEAAMVHLGISGKVSRRKWRTTIVDPAARPASDLVERGFGRGGLDELWIGDITAVRTGEGWLYVASSVDVCSRRCVGWAMADHMRDELCTDALRAASATRRRARFDGLIFHSDHGVQYTGDNFKLLCADMHITQSMGTVGDSYDNAMAESFWASLKREAVDGLIYETREQARLAIFEWIVWYNRVRLHSSIGYRSPEEYEQSLSEQSSVA